MEYSDTDTVDPEPPGSLLKGKTILLVNTGSENKRFILERLVKLGLKIVVLNKKKNWAEPFVTHWILENTYDHKACVEGVRKFLLKNPDMLIDGAVTFWEDDVPLLAKICEAFGFIGNSVESARNTRSKFDMHEALREKGCHFIPQHLIKNHTDLEHAMRSIGFPAVIKPTYGSDSEFVVYVENDKQAMEAYEYIRKNCTSKFNPIFNYNEGEFVYQKFIQGKEFSAECFIQNGIPAVVGIHEKTGMDLPFFMETGDYCPPRIDAVKQTVLIEEVKAALIALGVKNSLAHVEIKWTKQGPQIIEVASRMGGVYIYRSVKQVYKFDLIQTACEIACGLPVSEKSLPPQKCVLAKFFIPRKSGVITALRGFDELPRHKYAIDSFIGKKLYDFISVPPDGYEALGWVLTAGHSYNDAEKKMNAIMETVSFGVAVPQVFVIPETRPFLKPVSVQL